MAQTGDDINKAAEILTRGGLVAIPTETVYGLAANALDEKAVLKIFEAKQRPFFDPLIVHLASAQQVERYASLDDPRLKRLAEIFWPGPLTLLLPKKDLIPGLVTSGLDRVGVRVPQHDLSLNLLRAINFPLAAPSANPFGYVSPTRSSHVDKQLGGSVDYILDGGPSTVGLESTIVGVEDDTVCVYRLGGLAVEKIEEVIGPISLRLNKSSNPQSPGQLKNHYAPSKPFLLGDLNQLLGANKGKKIAAITFGGGQSPNGVISFNLSPRGDLHEAAINLFRYLREADESDADLVMAQTVPEHGLGRAINDRLQRAAAK